MGEEIRAGTWSAYLGNGTWASLPADAQYGFYHEERPEVICAIVEEQDETYTVMMCENGKCLDVFKTWPFLAGSWKAISDHHRSYISARQWIDKFLEHPFVKSPVGHIQNRFVIPRKKGVMV